MFFRFQNVCCLRNVFFGFCCSKPKYLERHKVWPTCFSLFRVRTSVLELSLPTFKDVDFAFKDVDFTFKDADFKDQETSNMGRLSG